MLPARQRGRVSFSLNSAPLVIVVQLGVRPMAIEALDIGQDVSIHTADE